MSLVIKPGSAEPGFSHDVSRDAPALPDEPASMPAIVNFESELKKSSTDASSASSPDAVFQALESCLVEQQDFHRLFDAKLIRVRYQLGLPITQPTSLKSVPPEHDAAFRAAYTQAAREVGHLFLAAGQLPDAWAYLRTIHEPQPVRDAIERRISELIPEPGPQIDELLNLALYEGAHVVEGLKLLLKMNGICNTVTAMGQLLPQMSPQERRQAAAVLVQTIYADLLHNVQRDVERRKPLLTPVSSLRELITGREFLFAEGGYHVDVSHLHSIVSFARHLERSDPELRLAIELAQYGAQLAEPLRYPADVPFDDYYVANQHFLQAVAGVDVDEALAYFIERLNQEPDLNDKRMIAFVIVDLGQRVGQVNRALEAAAPFVSRLEDPNGFSFTAFCVDAGRCDVLEAAARENDDVLAFATAQLAKGRQHS